jgi:SAM-dependent methyltransferase
MLRRLKRIWELWGEKANLLGSKKLTAGRFYDREIRYQDLRIVLQAGGPELPPYSGLASVWSEYNEVQLPDYPRFIAYLARSRGLILQSALDLACGTGDLTVRLTGVAEHVVGLDASEPMLVLAKSRCGNFPQVDLIQGDFRGFSLGRQFDAVVCASNSLNYVADRTELSQVFQTVAKHLRPGGLFVFDTITEAGKRQMSGLYYHVDVNGSRFVIRFSYDTKTRKETSVAILPSGLETHRRIPIDPKDVEIAAIDSGLVVNDYFSSALFPWRSWVGIECYFVLSRKD